jgi:uncharacterized protein
MRIHGLLRVLLAAVLVHSLGAMSDAAAQSVERLALANRLLDALDFDNSQERFATRQMPGVSPEGLEMYKAFRNVEKKYLTPDKLRPHAARAYASLFTDEELRTLISFFDSPTGRKFTETRPAIADSIQRVISEVLREHSEELREGLIKRLPEQSEPPE